MAENLPLNLIKRSSLVTSARAILVMWYRKKTKQSRLKKAWNEKNWGTGVLDNSLKEFCCKREVKKQRGSRSYHFKVKSDYVSLTILFFFAFHSQLGQLGGVGEMADGPEILLMHLILQGCQILCWGQWCPIYPGMGHQTTNREIN